MFKKFLPEFKKHVEAHGDKEACALVIQKGRKQQLILCENTHPDPSNYFRVSAEEWASAEDKGDIVAVMHSHPGDGARAIASPLDIASCNKTGVVWAIYAPDSDDYAEIKPEERSLVGRNFVLGSDDCWGLIMDWHQRQGVTLSDWRVNYPWWEDQYKDNFYQDNWKKEGFEEAPEGPGCMIIFQYGANKWNHAGIVTEDGMLLHHLYGKPSAIEPFKSGYLRDRAMICLRHKDLPKDLKPWKN